MKPEYEEIANSPEFKKFINSGLAALMNSHHRTNNVPVELYYDECDNVTAYTDDKRCVVNCGYPLFRRNATEREFMYRILGVTFHEFGHVLYTDFLEKRRSIEAFSSGIVQAPKGMTPAEERCFQEMLEAISGNSQYSVSGVKNVLINAFCAINNAVEDGRIERLLHRKDAFFSGYVKGLDALNTEMKKAFPNDAPEESVPYFLNAVLEYAKFGEIQGYHGEISPVNDAMPVIDRMLQTEASSELMEESIRLVMLCWALLKKELENSSSPEEAEEKIQQAAEAAEKIRDQEQTEETPETNSESPGTASNADGKADSNSSDSSGTEESEEAESAKEEKAGSAEPKASPRERADSDEIGSVLKEIKRAAAGRNAREKAMKEAESQYSLDPDTAPNCQERTVVKNVHPTRNPMIDQELVLARKENRAAIRQLTRILEEDQRVRISKRKFSGKKFHAEKVVNRDFRYFENKSVAKAVPKIAMGVVVDQSGSMHGLKAETATKTAIRLFHLLDGIENVDLSIIGHNSHWMGDGREIYVYPYLLFGEKPSDGAYCLGEMATRFDNGNVDAVVFAGMSESLKAQDAERKVEIIISDGLPHPSFAAHEQHVRAEEEVQKVLLRNKKSGIQTIAFAITDSQHEWECFQGIYSDIPIQRIEDPVELPGKMIQLVKRLVLA